MPKTEEQCAALRDDMRQRILRASLPYFARNGLSGTRIGDLSRHIGVGQGTIYRYFESKEDLFRAVRLLVSNEEDVRQLRMLAELPLSAQSKIRTLAADVVRRLSEDELFAASVALNTQMMLELADEPSSGGRCQPVALRQSDLYALTADIVQQGQREGSVVEGDPMRLADFFWGVAYLNALKALFAQGRDMVAAADMERTLLEAR